MRIRAMILGAVLLGAALLLAGCGSSGHKSPAATHAVTTTRTTSTAPEPAITHRLLTVSEIPSGYSPAGTPLVATSIQQNLAQDQTPSYQVASETARYKRLGFVSSASQ